MGDVQGERVTSQGAKNLGLKTSLIGKWEEGVGIWERASDFRKIRLRGRGEGDSLSHSLWCGVCFWAAFLDERPPPPPSFTDDSPKRGRLWHLRPENTSSCFCCFPHAFSPQWSTYQSGVFWSGVPWASLHILGWPVLLSFPWTLFFEQILRHKAVSRIEVALRWSLWGLGRDAPPLPSGKGLLGGRGLTMLPGRTIGCESGREPFLHSSVSWNISVTSSLPDVQWIHPKQAKPASHCDPSLCCPKQSAVFFSKRPFILLSTRFWNDLRELVCFKSLEPCPLRHSSLVMHLALINNSSHSKESWKWNLPLYSCLSLFRRRKMVWFPECWMSLLWWCPCVWETRHSSASDHGDARYWFFLVWVDSHQPKFRTSPDNCHVLQEEESCFWHWNCI